MIEKPNASIRAGGKTYSPNEVHAILARLAQLGINRDKIIAQITPEEAMVLKRLGGSGKINPKTGLLSFDDGDGGGAGYGDDGGGYSGGEYDGGGSYDGYGGGWEGGTGGTYGGEAGYGDFDAGAFADAVAANNEAMSAAIEDAASYSADPDAPAPGAQPAGFWSDVRGYFGGPPISNEAPPGYPSAQSLIATPGGSSYWGGTPSIESQLPTIEAPGPLYGFGPAPGVSGASPYDSMSMAQLDAAAQNLAAQIEAQSNAQQQGVTLDMPFSEGFIPGTGPGASITPAEEPTEQLDQIDVTAPAWLGSAPVAPGGAGSWLSGGQTYLSEDGQSVGPFTFGGPGTGGFPAAGTNLGSQYGGTIVSDAFSPFGSTAAGSYNAAAWMGSLGPDYQSQGPVAQTPTGEKSSNDIIQGVLDAAPTAPAWTTPPANIPNLPTVREEQPVEPQTTPFGPSGLPDIGAFPDSGDTGGTEWVNPTELVPKAEEPVLIDKGGLESPPVPTTPVVAAPVLPTQLIDWYHYGESNPEFSYYQSNRVPTPYKAHGGYFDADAYFAEGGLVSEPRAPVQPAVASAPTMAYTDGQGMVGSIAAPPALSPYDAYGSDAQHASPMAPAPAAAAPSIGGPLEMLASRNKNAMPFPSQISQNPNLGYSLGMSPLSRLRG